MVVKWSAVAEERLKGIFDYYLHAAGNKVAMQLVVKVRDSVDSLRSMPLMAPLEKDLTDMEPAFRSLIINRHYKAIYFIDDENIMVVDIWDCRQNLVKLRRGIINTKN